MAKFVRNPGMQWSEAKDSVQPAPDAYSKQELKEIIERRRRNDFVRRREFDMLRKVRAAGGAAGIDVSNRPSFFETSTVSNMDERGSTLKKIDDIEAQMSQQWWEGKPGPRPPGQGAAPTASSDKPPLIADLLGGAATGTPQAQPGRGFIPTAPGAMRAAERSGATLAPTEPMPLRQAMPDALAPTEPMPLHFPGPDALAPTEPMPLQGQQHQPTEPMPLAARKAAATGQGELMAFSGLGAMPAPAAAAAPAGQAAGLLGAKDQEYVFDPELDEVAIRFASGDDEAVEAVLVAALAPGAAKAGDDEAWMTLFDFYRAIGNQARFDTAAMDYAKRFEKSAPIWYSLPEMVGKMGGPAAGGAAMRGNTDWSCPVVMGIQSFAALHAALERLPQPWKLNWTKLNRIDEAGLPAFEKLLNGWCTRTVQIRFFGADRLMDIVKAHTVNGDKSVNQAWWRLRMMLLRVMHRPDEFEVVALDFCITYEVSPPSWEDAKCGFKALDEEGVTMLAHHTLVGETFHDALPPAGMPTELGQSTQFSQVSVVELAGVITGDPAPALAEIDEKLAGADVMVISCAKLIRADFTAAGALLNWAAAHQAEGRLVQFSSLHRLVAAFFHVIGINEHARIVVRTQ